MTIPRIYPILDSATGPWPALGLAPAVAALIEGGARILQLRHKGAWTRALFAEAREAAALCRAAGTELIIDDRADIAALLGCGLHVGQDDLEPRDARRIVGPHATLGFSSHNPEQLRAAAGEPLTYIALGPIFPTASKRNPDPVVGLDQLRACRGLVDLPLVAIGGITRANVRTVIEAGADAVAVIGDMIPDPCHPQSLRERIEEWRQLLNA